MVHLMDHPEALSVTSAQIREWTAQDLVLFLVLQFTQVGWPAIVADNLKPYWARRYELSVEEGCLLWGVQVVTLPPGQRHMLHELHQAHPGIKRMKELARALMCWPSIDTEKRSQLNSASHASCTSPNRRRTLCILGNGRRSPGRAYTLTMRTPHCGRCTLEMKLRVRGKKATSEVTVEKLRVCCPWSSRLYGF